MGAEILGELDEARLVELADEVAGVRDGPLDRDRVVRVGAQIAGAQLGRGEERPVARKIEHQVAGGSRAVAGLAEDEAPAGGGGGKGVVVDLQRRRRRDGPWRR